MPTYNFSTGSTQVQDAGVLNYNSCVFSPLYETRISGKVIHDNAQRTTKLMEYTLTADGYVTLSDNFPTPDINPMMNTLRLLLTQQGGALTYRGRGFDLVVNSQANGVQPGKINNRIGIRDVAWGPVPELIEFQPLGGGRSAKVQWKVTVRIPEVKQSGGGGLLQLNYETTVSYGEDGFSALAIRGTLEVPMTRTPTQNTRTLVFTADDYRQILTQRILGTIDLEKFRITRREFNVSRDKRTLEWDVGAEERPYMDPPPNCTVARGTYSVRPVKAGTGLGVWLCTLKATYTVRPGSGRREAWLAFLALLRLRMESSKNGEPPAVRDPQPPKRPSLGKTIVRGLIGLAVAGVTGNPLLGLGTATALMAADPGEAGIEGVEKSDRKVWLIDLSIDEGLYLDSKNVTFSATWRLLSKFAYILMASGVWTKVSEENAEGANLWAISMKDISGHRSWLENRLDPSIDVIVDFGSGV